MSQRYHGIHPHRPPRRNPAGENSDNEQERRHNNQRQWIAWMHSKKNASQKTRHAKRSRNSRHHPDKSKCHSFTDHAAQHISPSSRSEERRVGKESTSVWPT